MDMDQGLTIATTVISFGTLVFAIAGVKCMADMLQARDGERLMASNLQQSIEARLSRGKMFFTYGELARVSGKLAMLELERLVRKRKLSKEAADILRSALCQQMGLWDYYPRPVKKNQVPDPMEVKTMIKLRIDRMRCIVVRLPDERPLPTNPLEELLYSL